MSVYKIRKNHFPSFHYKGSLITGKVAVKTANTDWLGTQKGVFLPISIKTSFHEGAEGEMKMRAMIETTRSSIQAPLLLLLADTAHCNVEELLEGPQARTKRLGRVIK